MRGNSVANHNVFEFYGSVELVLIAKKSELICEKQIFDRLFNAAL